MRFQCVDLFTNSKNGNTLLLMYFGWMKLLIGLSDFVASLMGIVEDELLDMIRLSVAC
jgi:hypothetical protein